MSSIHPNDHQVLRSIFFPSAKSQGKRILVRTPETPLRKPDLEEAAGLIDFGKTKSLPDFNSMQFDYVNNPDGSIRWLVPSACDKPAFLKLYNGSGTRSWLYRMAFKTCYALGARRLATSGSLRVFYREAEPFEGLIARSPSPDFAIFTGTVGENRKAVFSLKWKDGKDWFFKLPFNEKSAGLVEQEHATLQSFSTFSFGKIAMPKVLRLGPGILVSNVRPSNPIDSLKLQSVHFQALRELAAQTGEHGVISSLPAWSAIGENLKKLETSTIKNDFPNAKISLLRRGLSRLYANFDPYGQLPTYIAHGDFTSWNMYLSNEKLHVYDWELSGRLPLLYDAFHFIFQSGVLIERAPYATLRERVLALKNEPLVIEMLGDEMANFENFYQFYLLQNVSYYLVRYIQQQPLHEQAHWLVDTWLEAVEDWIESTIHVEEVA